MSRLGKLLSRFQKPSAPEPNLSSFASLCDRSVARTSAWKAVGESSAQPAGHVAILITSWVQSATPLFSLELAFALRHAGCKVTLLWDEAVLAINADNRTPYETKILAGMLSKIGNEFPRIDVCSLPAVKSPLPDKEYIRKLLWENFIWFSKKEEGAADRLNRNPQFCKEAELHTRRIMAALRKVEPDWVLIPGGVFGVSGLYLEACRKEGVDFTTYDSGPDLLAACHQGVAGLHGDVSVTLRKLEELYSPAFLAEFSARGQTALFNKMRGDDPWEYQIKPSGRDAVSECDILLCLNRRADTAAMMRLRLFSSVREWIEDMILWVKNRGNGRLVVRQHPCERWERFKTHDDYAAWIKALDPEGNYVTFIPSDSEVNTYSLVNHAKVVLPFTSRTGIEATLLDKPIIMGTNCFYADMGFGWTAKSKEEYFSLIDEALSGRLHVSEAHKSAAGLLYFVFSTCEWLSTSFTPRPEDFENWAGLPPEELWSSEVLKDFRESLITRTPVPLRRFHRLYGEAENVNTISR